jgi:hypothetical protein
MTPPTVQFIPAAGEDWDTYADGVYKQNVGFLVEPVAYSGSAGLIAFGRNGVYYGFRYNSTAGATNAAPFMALWNDTDGFWVNYYPKVIINWFGTLNGALYVTPLSNFPSGKQHYLIPLSQAPANLAGWRNYDGPT